MSAPDVETLEKEIEELRSRLDALQPLVDLYAGGKIAGKIIIWIGGVIMGVSTFWLAFGKTFGDHLN